MTRAPMYQETLRRLAIIDEQLIGNCAGLRLGLDTAGSLDAKTAALVRVGALAAIGSSEACLEWSTSQALAAGASEDEITAVLLTIAPVIGLSRIVDAASGVAVAVGYDIDTALLDPHAP